MRFEDLLEIWRAPIVQDGYSRRRDWDNARRIWSGPASVQPYRAYEDRDPSNETASTMLNAYLPPSAEPDSADRVLYNGAWYDVLSEPARWDKGRLPHVVVRLWGVTH
ncbi:hypothetical protein [Streptomyces rimosus]|uniref:hypothetical protein n=1 Tax=Streptomyces rimosus TaxID=1927 RepID=UPI00067DDCA2|nr:hypothetical protein [Streptomyces rimosus]